MDKQNIMLILLYITITATIVNSLVFSNRKFTESPRGKKLFRLSLTAGIVLFFITLIGYLYIRMN